MDLRQLEMFQAIVETGSFTGAGEKLYVSQSAISRQIKLLEEELGDQIFKRIHKKIYLTPTGEILLQYAKKVFNDLRLMMSEISDLTNLRRGSLHLAGGMSVCMYLFPLLLKEYQKRYPNIELNVATGTNDEILRLIRANEVDLALLSLPITDPDLEVRPALTEEMVLVMEKDHPLAKRKRIEFRDLEPFTFIHFERGSNTRKVVEQTFSEENVTFRNTMELQNVEITKPLVEQGLGISLIPYPAIAAARDARGLEFRRIGDREIYRELGWVSLKSDYMSRAMTKLLSLFDDIKDQLTSTERPLMQ
ncbi:MAG TPA: LysR family transcriptional regulator [Acidobacteriota bacterium]|nr:LysR family transcriptional regulator [Acidobacteriota bacterium]